MRKISTKRQSLKARRHLFLFLSCGKRISNMSIKLERQCFDLNQPFNLSEKKKLEVVTYESVQLTDKT